VRFVVNRFAIPTPAVFGSYRIIDKFGGPTDIPFDSDLMDEAVMEEGRPMYITS
jgi:hypothetical protein